MDEDCVGQLQSAERLAVRRVTPGQRREEQGHVVAEPKDRGGSFQMAGAEEATVPGGAEQEDATYTLVLSTLAGPEITVDVRASDTVNTITGWIEARKGVPAYQQRLILKGVELQGCQTLRDCGCPVALTWAFHGCGGLLQLSVRRAQ